MAQDMFSRWDKEIDTEGLQKDVAEAAANGGNYKEVPHGNYEVAVQQMELKASKTLWSAFGSRLFLMVSTRAA